MSVWEQPGRYATRTRRVTGAILAPHETQRRVVSDKTGTYASATPGKSICVPLDLGGEMVTQFVQNLQCTRKNIEHQTHMVNHLKFFILS